MINKINNLINLYNEQIKSLSKDRDKQKDIAANSGDIIESEKAAKHAAFLDGEIAANESFVEDLKKIIDK